MPRRLIDLGEQVAAPISRRTGLAALIGVVAGAVGLSDIDAKKKKKKKKKPITVCASGCTYTSLQAAITASPAGSTICLKGGEYNESVGIGKSLTINPCDPTEPVTIRGLGTRPIDVDLPNDSDTVKFDGIQPGGLIFQGQSSPYIGGVIRFSTPEGATTKGALLIQNAVVTGGNAVNGGGIYVNTTGNLDMTDTRIASCSSTYAGGGLHVSTGEVFLDGTTQITMCNSVRGAGVFLTQAGKLTMNGNSMIGGTAGTDKNEAYGDPGVGGGIYASDGTRVSMNSSAMIKNNKAANYGGGIYAEQGASLLEQANCTNQLNITANTLSESGVAGPQIYHANTSSIC